MQPVNANVRWGRCVVSISPLAFSRFQSVETVFRVVNWPPFNILSAAYEIFDAGSDSAVSKCLYAYLS